MCGLGFLISCYGDHKGSTVMGDIGLFSNILQTSFMGVAVVAGVFFMMRYLQRDIKIVTNVELEELKIQLEKNKEW